MILTLVLVVAAILALVELIRSEARSLLAWAVVLIALVLIVGRLG